MEEVRSYTGGSFNKFKRGVVYDPSIGKKISVTIVATGFEINSLPQIDMDIIACFYKIIINSGHPDYNIIVQ